VAQFENKNLYQGVASAMPLTGAKSRGFSGCFLPGAAAA